MEANQNLPEELSKKHFLNSLMHISINSLPAECNEPEHTVAINAQKKLFLPKKKKKERNEKKKRKGTNGRKITESKNSILLPLCLTSR